MYIRRAFLKQPKVMWWGLEGLQPLLKQSSLFIVKLDW